MNELSLFTGAGGGVLGSLLLGWRTIGYVEWDNYCQQVIRRRIEDGILHNAPIFGDIRAFIGDGYAERYRGMVDVITAGFPCQPFSTAGKRAGEDDPRNMWPATIECIRVVRPRFALLENVPGLLSSGYFGTILGDLAESGYDARWRILSAAELGAPHKRDRLWIAVTDAASEREHRERRNNDSTARAWHKNEQEFDTSGTRDVADADSQRQSQPERRECQELRRTGDGCTGNTTSAGLSDGVNGEMGGGTQGLEIVQSQRPDWWTTEPDVGRVAHGLASRVDRLKAIGNGQVPAVVRAAWLLLGGER